MQRDSVCRISFGLKALVSVLCLALLGACASIPVAQREGHRAEIDRDAEETIALLIERDPEFAEALDKWAGIVGANWDINSRWALQAEYEGFRGSRESIIASLGWRF